MSRKVECLLVFQTLTLPGEEPCQEMYNCEIHERDSLAQPGWPRMAFIENRLSGDPTNWWVPNHAAVEAMLRTCGRRIIGRPGHEIYLCQPDPMLPSNALTWNEAELLAATGQAVKNCDKMI